ncbi:hypothetical protein [Escherichia phage vB_EcoM-E33]|nr:hypothetical protein PSD9_257 [Shigella phage PSD9]UCR81245.1 hypothetical protein PSD2002_0129 [Escherichia phage PSD2002]UKH49086.1 hypothetical protein [Escherichia phage vB_EcoM-E33]WPJ21623.1 hypothetical protein [Salmonella phage vB_SalD_ABTNLS3]
MSYRKPVINKCPKPSKERMDELQKFINAALASNK